MFLQTSLLSTRFVSLLTLPFFPTSMVIQVIVLLNSGSMFYFHHNVLLSSKYFSQLYSYPQGQKSVSQHYCLQINLDLCLGTTVTCNSSLDNEFWIHLVFIINILYSESPRILLKHACYRITETSIKTIKESQSV